MAASATAASSLSVRTFLSAAASRPVSSASSRRLLSTASKASPFFSPLSTLSPNPSNNNLSRSSYHKATTMASSNKDSSRSNSSTITAPDTKKDDKKESNNNNNNNNNTAVNVPEAKQEGKRNFSLRGAANSALNWIIWPATIATILPAAPILLVYRWLKHRKPVIDPRGKVVLITGASSGICREVAKEFARRGAKLFLCARREERLEGGEEHALISDSPNTQDVAQEAKELGSPDVAIRPTDVKHEDECKAMVEDCVKRFGGVDILVLGAGVASMYFFEEAETTEGFRDPYDVDVWGTIYPTYYALDELKKAKGHIVVTGSVASFTAFPKMSLYNGAKAAVYNFFDTLRVELNDSVGITLVCPGFVKSEMTGGKTFLTPEGRQMNDPDHIMVIFHAPQAQRKGGVVPLSEPDDLALAMVDATLARKRLLVFPSWGATFLLLRVFAPELQDLLLRLLYVPREAEKRETGTPVPGGKKSQ
eukprot:jgi/Chlat1/5989/Chrsp4S06303